MCVRVCVHWGWGCIWVCCMCVAVPANTQQSKQCSFRHQCSILEKNHQSLSVLQELFYCHGLRILSLADNELVSIPPAIASLHHLTHLDISKNGRCIQKGGSSIRSGGSVKGGRPLVSHEKTKTIEPGGATQAKKQEAVLKATWGVQGSGVEEGAGDISSTLPYTALPHGASP